MVLIRLQRKAVGSRAGPGPRVRCGHDRRLDHRASAVDIGRPAHFRSDFLQTANVLPDAVVADPGRRPGVPIAPLRP